jgi:hypothetical protein
MKKISLIAIGLLLLFAAITNPSRKIHVAVVAGHVADTYKEIFGRDIGSGSAGGHGFFTMYEAVDGLIHTDNYLLFSITEYTNGRETKPIGIGAFGYVHLFRKVDKDNLKSRYHDSISDKIKF